MSAKIAIVEDDPAIQQMYELKLKHSGYQVEVATNGREGLALVERFRPDLILLDILMPEMNGDEMLAQVRATEWGKDTRVIVLTNISETEAPTSLKTLNIDRYIIKAQHTPGQVLDMVDALFKSSSSQPSTTSA